MNLTDILVNEHRIIEQVLHCLEKMLDRCQSQCKLESGPAQDAVVFFRGFIARCHCNKQETQLLPAMQDMGISPEQCSNCSIFRRSKECFSHLDAMEAMIESASDGDPVALKVFTGHAQAYIGLLLAYIAKQEDCLFPIIDQTLPEADKTRIRTAMQTAYGSGEDNCACNTYIDLANRLADHFDVPRAVIVDVPNNRSGEKSWNGANYVG